MVNGASEESGRRIITSTIKPPFGVDAHDFHELTGRDVPISSAIHNGARFPYVSPAGTLTSAGGKPTQGHIIDGGYFDAVGTEAVRELADAVARGPGRGEDLRFIFVVIAYGGPTKADSHYTGAPPPLNPEAAAGINPVWWANEVLAPVRGFAGSRSGHGNHMATELRGAILGEKLHNAPGDPLPATITDAYVPVLLCEPTEFRNPMNWALSKRARDHMRCASSARFKGDGDCKVVCTGAVSAIDWTVAALNAAKPSLQPPPRPREPPPPP